MDLISVVVPVYNVERYIAECLDSILRQTYVNLQILLIDDGSTDSSSEICDVYAQKDNRIELIHKKNGGLSDARNVGIQMAKGQFITFVDSDDLIADDMIEKLYLKICNDKSDISVCQRLLINEWGEIIKRTNKRIEDFTIRGNRECVHEFMNSGLIDTVAWGKLYMIDLFSDIFYPVGRYHEDVFTTYRLIAKSNAISIIGDRKYLYRERNSSITQSSFSSKHFDAIYGKEEILKFMAKKYPQELHSAMSGVIYSANHCLIRMARSHNHDKKFTDILQSKYRKYEKSFLLYSRSRLIVKIFSLIAYFNVRFLVIILSYKYKND